MASFFIIFDSKKDQSNVYYYEDIQPYESELYTDQITAIDYVDKLVSVGDLQQDTVVSHKYVLRNIGDNPLIIYYVNPDCNCSSYDLSKKIAMPKDSIVVNIQVNTKGKRLGQFMVNTVLRANTKDEMYCLRLSGNIVKP